MAVLGMLFQIEYSFMVESVGGKAHGDGLDGAWEHLEYSLH